MNGFEKNIYIALASFIFKETFKKGKYKYVHELPNNKMLYIYLTMFICIGNIYEKK